MRKIGKLLGFGVYLDVDSVAWARESDKLSIVKLARKLLLKWEKRADKESKCE